MKYFNPVIRGDGAAPLEKRARYRACYLHFNPVIRGDGAAPPRPERNPRRRKISIPLSGVMGLRRECRC